MYEAAELQTYFNNWIWPVLSGSASWLKKAMTFWKNRLLSGNTEQSFLSSCLLKHQMNPFSVAEAGSRDGGRERGRDGWIPLNRHLYQPSSPLWGGCLRALRNKLRVIFLSDADWREGDNNDFSHVIKGIFTSACGSRRIVFIPPCDKYLIDEQRYHRTMCCAATGLKRTRKVIAWL